MPKVTSITVSCAPKVWITQYKSFNPHASITISDPEGLDDSSVETAMDEAVVKLRSAVNRALKTEIEYLNDVSPLAQMETTDDLLEFCMKEIKDAPVTVKATSEKDHTRLVAQKENRSGEASGHKTVRRGVKKIGKAIRG